LGNIHIVGDTGCVPNFKRLQPGDKLAVGKAVRAGWIDDHNAWLTHGVPFLGGKKWVSNLGHAMTADWPVLLLKVSHRRIKCSTEVALGRFGGPERSL
jgi:hypothetical protein